MRSKLRVIVALSLTAVVAACGKESPETFNPIVPRTDVARVRVANATNTTIEISTPAEEWLAINSNIRHSVSRCFELAPNTAPLVRDSATKTLFTGLPSNFEAGKSYAVVIYRPTTTATTYSYASWETGQGQYVPPADSGGFRVINLSPNAGATGIDVYVNIPNSVSVPPMTTANRKAAGLTVGNAMPFIPLKADVSYQVRQTRAGSTTSANTLRDETFTVQEGETMTVVLGIPSLTAATTFRSFSLGGC